MGGLVMRALVKRFLALSIHFTFYKPFGAKLNNKVGGAFFTNIITATNSVFKLVTTSNYFKTNMLRLLLLLQTALPLHSGWRYALGLQNNVLLGSEQGLVSGGFAPRRGIQIPTPPTSCPP